MIVVIGATGFLGSHLICHLLQSDDKIRATYRSKQSIDECKKFLQYYNIPITIFEEKIEWVFADVNDIETIISVLNEATFVYNCSGFVSFKSKDKDLMIAVNALGTANIVNASINCKCKKLVHVSSIAALGETNSEELISEETKWVRKDTESWYSITKFNGETEAWRASAEGLSVVIVNPSVIIGPGNWKKGSPMLFKTVNDGLSYYTNGITGFVDVRDVCNIMILLMQSSIENEQFIITGSNQSFKDVFTCIAKKIGKPEPTKHATPLLLSIAWRMDKMLSLIMNKELLITKNSARTSMKKNYYSNTKIIEKIGFCFTSFDETISFTGNGFLQDCQK